MAPVKPFPARGTIHYSQLKIIAPVLFIATLFVYTFYAPLRELYRDWTIDPNYSHGFLVPIISAYFLWHRRSELKLNRSSFSWIGLLVMVLGMAGAIIGSAAAEWFVLRTSMLLFLQGIILFVFGWPAYKHIWFPMNYLWLMIPLPYVIYYSMTFPLQRLSSYLAYLILSIMGVPTLLEGNILHFPNFSLEVIEACSGLRSIMVLLALSAPIAYMSSLRLSCKILLFLSAIPIAIVANTLRLVITAFTGLFGNPEYIEDMLMHQGAGILVFFLGLILVLSLNHILLRVQLCRKSS